MGKEEKELLAEIVESAVETHGKIKSLKGKKHLKLLLLYHKFYLIF